MSSYLFLVESSSSSKGSLNIKRHSFLYSCFQFGQTAEFYLNHEESEKILSHRDLLRSFGAAEELADEMLNDQGIFLCSLTSPHCSTYSFITSVYYSMKLCYMIRFKMRFSRGVLPDSIDL